MEVQSWGTPDHGPLNLRQEISMVRFFLDVL